jgi:spermidine synthase
MMALHNLREQVNGTRRYITEGPQGLLTKDGEPIMGNSIAELTDAWGLYSHLDNLRNANVLILGLGLGIIPHILTVCYPGVRIDVVEKDPIIIKHTGRHLFDSDKVNIIEGDALHFETFADKLYANDGNYDAVWSDIWPDICIDNLRDMRSIDDDVDEFDVLKPHGRVFHWAKNVCVMKLREYEWSKYFNMREIGMEV